jgi:hypothetical protein
MEYFVLDHPLSESRMESSEQVGRWRTFFIWAPHESRRSCDLGHGSARVTSTVDGEGGQLGKPSRLRAGVAVRARHSNTASGANNVPGNFWA